MPTPTPITSAPAAPRAASEAASAVRSPAEEPAFRVGQIVSVDWERLGEVTEYLWNGFYRVWVETDFPNRDYWTVHQNRLESL